MTGKPENNEYQYLTPKGRIYEQLILLISQALHFPRQHSRHAMEKVGKTNFRGISRNNVLMGGLGLIPMGQFFGGCRVGAVGVVAVGVSPEFRGKGAGSALLSKTLQELFEKEVPISVLYPSTVGFYQKFGYVVAGHRCTYEMNLPMIPPAKSSLEMVPARFIGGRPDVFEGAYKTRALTTNGNLDRHPYLWERALFPPSMEVHRYLVIDQGKVTGYLSYTQGGQWEPLNLLDVCSLNRETTRRLLEFVGSHRTVTGQAFWSGSSRDPFLDVLPNPAVKIINRHQWMIRIVRPDKAIEQRGYPKGLSGTLHLKITDELIPENNCNLQVDFNAGKATVTPGGDGLVTLSVDQLGCLYTSYTTPSEMTLTAPVTGPDEQVDLLTRAFAGPSPWMPDIF